MPSTVVYSTVGVNLWSSNAISVHWNTVQYISRRWLFINTGMSARMLLPTSGCHIKFPEFSLEKNSIHAMWPFCHMFWPVVMCDWALELVIVCIVCGFSALTLLVWRQKEHPANRKWVLRCWCGLVICLQYSANDLDMVELMPLPPHHLLLH